MDPLLPPDGRRPPLIPPHIAWPAFIVFLLAISITMAVGTFFVARSDGGARIIVTTPDTTADASGQ